MSAIKSAVGIVVFLLTVLPSHAQSVGDTVRLHSNHPSGVPVHPESGDHRFVRWAGGTIGNILAQDPQNGWIKVDSYGRIGWITKNYLTVIPQEDTDDAPLEEILSYAVGTWNLEHFKDGKPRGFPENTRSGPSYGARVNSDFRWIADIIKTQLFTSVLVLNEVNGNASQRSIETERLILQLGTNWAYDIGGSGGSQRVAILYDRSTVTKVAVRELDMPNQTIDGASLFARKPLVGKFAFLDTQGTPQNDFLVVGLHLASGQAKVNNHNKAMAHLKTALHLLCDNGDFAGEKDILILGDFNASRYDNKIEDFWDNYDSTGFKFRTLSPEDGEEYPGTRLAGVPLSLRSQIDYIVASGLSGGLFEKLVQVNATVHTELVPAPGTFDTYRRHISDHLPVTVKIRVMPDSD